MIADGPAPPAPRREGAPPALDGGVGIDGAPGPGHVRRFSHEAMATVFEVHADHPDSRYAAQAAHAAFDLVDRLERELSRFLPNSDIGRINQLAAGEQTRVGPAAMECLVIARHLFDLTGGAFDVSVGTGLPSVELDPDGCRVRATRTGVRLDLGAVGKGYAVDLMAALLEDWGLVRALVHGGFSSVLALEPPDGYAGWALTLSDPASPGRVLARLSARQMALGASGLRKGHHIVDPRTGAPVTGRRAAWAAVPRPDAGADVAGAGDGPRVAAAAVADALSTTFMLLDLDEIDALCSRSPGVEAWILPDTPDGVGGESGLLHVGPPGHSPTLL